MNGMRKTKQKKNVVCKNSKILSLLSVTWVLIIMVPRNTVYQVPGTKYSAGLSLDGNKMTVVVHNDACTAFTVRFSLQRVDMVSGERTRIPGTWNFFLLRQYSSSMHAINTILICTQGDQDPGINNNRNDLCQSIQCMYK